MSKKYWIKDALSNNKGALRRTAMRKGLLRDSDDKLSITDLHKLEKMGGKTAKRAYLAETLRKFEHGGNTHWDAEYRDGGGVNDVWITNALTTDKRILSKIFEHEITNQELYDYYKKQGYEIKETQIHKITNTDVLENYKDALDNYIKQKFSKNINWELTFIPYSVVQDKMIIGSHSVITTDGNEIEINPNDLFNSFSNGGGVGRVDISEFSVNNSKLFQCLISILNDVSNLVNKEGEDNIIDRFIDTYNKNYVFIIKNNEYNDLEGQVKYNLSKMSECHNYINYNDVSFKDNVLKIPLKNVSDKYSNGGGVELTKQKCFAFWNNEMAKDKNVYWDNQSYELNTTLMSEDAQHHFGVATDMGQTDIEKDIEDWAFEYVYDWEQKNKKYAYGGEIGDGFLISEMRNYLNKKFPDSFGFVVNTPESNTRAGFDLTPNQKEPYRGLSDSDIKSKLYFPQYKRDHEINYKIYQGSENTYFYFYLNDENGNPYIGQFGFKDDGDVDSTYITRFIAFLMEQYGLPFSVSHDVYAKGGGIKGKKGDIGKHTGKQYGYTLSEAEKAWKNILVSPTDYWKKEEGSVYTDSFGRRQVVRESSKSSIMTGYAYRIMILLDLGSNKVPASAKKYAMSIYEFAPNEISVKSYKNGGNIPYESFNYRLLDRLRSDNDYYLRHPHEKHLWAGSVDEQIKEMKRLWNNFPKDAKPEWLSMEDILEYERKMKNVSKYSNGGGIEEDYSDLKFASKQFSKTAEMLVKENLNNGEICMCKLTKILGHEPNYPVQIVGSLKLEKCFMKRFYKIA